MADRDVHRSGAPLRRGPVDESDVAAQFTYEEQEILDKAARELGLGDAGDLVGSILRQAVAVKRANARIHSRQHGPEANQERPGTMEEGTGVDRPGAGDDFNQASERPRAQAESGRTSREFNRVMPDTRQGEHAPKLTLSMEPDGMSWELPPAESVAERGVHLKLAAIVRAFSQELHGKFGRAHTPRGKTLQQRHSGRESQAEPGIQVRLSGMERTFERIRARSAQRAASKARGDEGRGGR